MPLPIKVRIHQRLKHILTAPHLGARILRLILLTVYRCQRSRIPLPLNQHPLHWRILHHHRIITALSAHRIALPPARPTTIPTYRTALLAHCTALPAQFTPQIIAVAAHLTLPPYLTALAAHLTALPPRRTRTLLF